VTRLFEDIARRTLEESEAQLAVIFSQVTEWGANVLYTCGHITDGDEAHFQGAFNPSRMLREPDPVHFILDVHNDPLINREFARKANLQSAAMFRLEMKDQLIVVALGFPVVREFAHCGLQMYSLAARLALLASLDVWPMESLTVLAEAMEEFAHSLERTSSLGSLLDSIGDLLRRALDHWNLQAYSAIWLLVYEPRDGDGKVVPQLSWATGFGRLPGNMKVRKLDIGQGVVGWVARHRAAVNLRPRLDGEKLPSGEKVADFYIPWDAEIRAELTVPLLYQNNLVGVLNIESPIDKRFGPEHVLLATMVAAHAAQVIHQQRLEAFYNQLLGMEDLNKLTQAIVREVGQLIESPLSSVYLWDIQEQCIRLAATSADTVDADGKPVVPGQFCFRKHGLGLVRWCFENEMWLCIDDIPAFSDSTHRQHDAVREAVLDQIWRQGAQQDREVKHPEDDRRFWRYSHSGTGAAQAEERQISEPVWTNECRYREDDLRTQIVIPILDPMPGRPALGVMSFSRRKGERSFTDHDVDLLQGVAREVARTIAHTKEQQSQKLEEHLISEVVTMEPGSWDTEFQRRLERQLENIRRVTGAYLVLVRARHGEHELSLVASCPTSDELEQIHGIRIPKVAYFGKGGSGQAAVRRHPVYMPNLDHSCLRDILDVPARPEAEQLFLRSIQSETAVPLFSGDKVIGTITAISFKPYIYHVRRAGASWMVEQTGIHPLHTTLLEFHARWLGPALETIKQIVRRDRQLSSLSTMAQQLTKLIDRGAPSELLAFATLVVATHNDGLCFHQAMIAEWLPDETGGMTILRGKKDLAWGCMSFPEQDHAHDQRDSLERDLQNSLANLDTYCRKLRENWSTFHCELKPNTTGPTLIRRQGIGPQRSPTWGRTVCCVEAKPASDLDHMLDAFCAMFGMKPEGVAGRKICVGMVPLARPVSRNGGANAVLFVTNVDFNDPFNGALELADVEEISLDSVDALQELANILGLAESVARVNQAAANSPGDSPQAGRPHTP
jgi:GAF domain-containing protein